MAKSVHALALRYGQAIFEIASQKKELDRFADSLRRLTEVANEAEIAAFLENPKVTAAAKQKLLAKHEPNVEGLVWNLLFLLVSRGHLGLFCEVAAEFNRRSDEAQGNAHGEVVTAVTLDSAELGEVKKQLKDIFGKEIDLTPRVDKTVLGGVIVRVGDKVIDGSTAGRLEALRCRLIESRI